MSRLTEFGYIGVLHLYAWRGRGYPSLAIVCPYNLCYLFLQTSVVVCNFLLAPTLPFLNLCHKPTVFHLPGSEAICSLAQCTSPECQDVTQTSNWSCQPCTSQWYSLLIDMLFSSNKSSSNCQAMGGSFKKISVVNIVTGQLSVRLLFCICLLLKWNFIDVTWQSVSLLFIGMLKIHVHVNIIVYNARKRWDFL